MIAHMIEPNDASPRVWHNARLVTMRPDSPGLGMVERGAVAARDGRIAFAGADADLPSGWNDTERIDCEGRWITPGLIDCHTHLVYGGNRAHEFEQRLAGVSYAEIARASGGIVSTVRATRQASEDELPMLALPRLDALIDEAVTTIEIKSGYGLDLETERRQLRAARQLGRERGVTVSSSFLGAHVVPAEMADDRGGYIDAICDVMLPAIAAEGLADAVDAFCETVAFSPEETSRVFAAARAHGLPVRLHADQLSNLRGAALAARFGALSADHLEYTDEAAPPPWPPQEPSQCCCPGLSTSFARRRCRRSRRSAATGFRSQLPPTAIPAPRR
jgi:imidazolonepropionase